MILKEINLFEFTSYREFLSEYYRVKKELSPYFSHRVFVRMCGFSSPNFLKLVMEGQRNLGKKALEKLMTSLKFNKMEREYFTALVSFEHSDSMDEKGVHMTTIARLRHRTGVKTIETDRYEYLSHWLNVAVRELISLDDFEEDVSWVNGKLDISLTEKKFTDIIDKLIKLKLVRRGKNGKLHQKASTLVCSPEIYSVAVNSYHNEMIAKAQEAIEKSSKNRDLSALTFSTDSETYERIRGIIKKCREEIHHVADESKNKEAVYQVNFQFFNLSEVSCEN